MCGEVMEKTLILIKPDGVARSLTGKIVHRFEERGLKVVALKLLKVSQEQAAIHYFEHKGKPFFERLLSFITSGPLVALVIKGENAVKVSRAMIGATNPADAQPGTIRGDFATALQYNVIHGSDSISSADREIANFFSPDEIFD